MAELNGDMPAAGGAAQSEGQAPTGPVIRDRRKVDPVTGTARATGGPAGEAAGQPDPSLVTPATGPGSEAQALEDEVIAAAELIAAREELAVRTEDLQRLSAEYANYRKRVDRDRALASDNATAEVLTALIPTLDDIQAARDAGELDGPFKAVAEKLEAALGKYGLERYGTPGDAFDPAIHEALLHQTSPEATGPTLFAVLQPGYRMGERVLRAARVGVQDQEG
ncbi:MAG: nucleotide exchange factor GrpE [Bifidobacteriaceae bacterium]|jgi:molecular chaperone GrpE|nr:nucleotide exchange factor GrpE [Bifidobacteriaceae bacterium]